MRANHNLPDDHDLLAEYRAGATVQTLAATYGTTWHTISRHLQAATHAGDALTTLTVGAPEWHQEAACADPQTPPDLFFPESGSRPSRAKSICADCPVRADCLRWALDNYEPHGIWGGYTPQERRTLLRRMPRTRTAS